jgi:hypothetical protein
MLAGHPGQHQAFVEGNSTSQELVWDKIRWDRESFGER